MEVKLKSTGAVMTESEFRHYISNKTGATYDTLTPEVQQLLGVDIVLEGPQASGASHYQYSQRDGVELIDGKWYTKYVLAPSPVPEEYKAQKDAQQAKSVRETRNKLLADCDWTQLADATVDKTVWAAYRQALRDIPKNAGFPWEVTYPESPIGA